MNKCEHCKQEIKIIKKRPTILVSDFVCRICESDDECNCGKYCWLHCDDCN
ncbi:MAG: hypothetical protein H9Q65_06230 [Spiroplasma ixodetis]|nr:hypothetical protein [Spiroplasma ixodetis]MBP1527513.1 hypothetical protein [Spiroplasma ixodetis]MBP1528819.1 hypothetical protein [Spiroplasma ixodetis]